MAVVQNFRNYPFSNCNSWSSDGRFLATVAAIWATPIQGCHMYRLVSKLKLLKKPLKELHKFAFLKLSDQVLTVRENLLEAQNLLQRACTDLTLIHNVTK